MFPVQWVAITVASRAPPIFFIQFFLYNFFYTIYFIQFFLYNFFYTIFFIQFFLYNFFYTIFFTIFCLFGRKNIVYFWGFFFVAKMKKKVSGRTFIRQPAASPETEFFLDWP